MSRAEVQGLPLADLVEPIYDSLNRLMEKSDGRFRISGKSKKAATQLELTPDKPNSARSTTKFKHLGEIAGELVIIVFKPGDGTGNESAFNLSYVDTAPYPAVAQVVPRSKRDIYSEVHFPVVAAKVDSPAQIFANAGNLDLLGLPALGSSSGNQVRSIGRLGQSDEYFRSIIDREVECPRSPCVTETIWHESVDGSAERVKMGNPHAVFNGYEDVIQVCGFMAIHNGADTRHASFARDLGAYPANQPVIQ